MLRRLPSSPGRLGTRWGSGWCVTYRTFRDQQTWRWHMLSYGFLVVYFIYNPLWRVTRTGIALMLGNAAANLQKLERNWPRGYVWCELVVVMFVAPNMIVYQIRDATLLYLPTLTPAGWKLRSQAGSRLQANFSRLIEKCELLPSCLRQFPKIC